MSKRLSNQGGAIRTYVIIAIILVIGTIAAIYFVQKRGEQVRRDQAIAQADQIAKDKQKTANTPATTKPTTTTTPTPTTPTVTPSPSPSELPTTGPQSSLLQLLMIGILAGALVAYVSSRRAVAVTL